MQTLIQLTPWHLPLEVSKASQASEFKTKFLISLWKPPLLTALFMTVNGKCLLLSTQSKNLGVIFDSSLLRLLKSTSKSYFLSKIGDSLRTHFPLCSNYCNSLLTGAPLSFIDPFTMLRCSEFYVLRLKLEKCKNHVLIEVWKNFPMILS